MTSNVDHFYQRQYIPEDPLEESVYRYVALCSQGSDNFSKKSGPKKLYKSKYAELAKTEYKNFKTGGKKINTEPVNPNKYLKKGERNKYEKEKHDKNAKYNTHKSHKNLKPLLPKSPGLLIKHESKNYIKNNIITNDNSIPRKPDSHTKTNPNINYLKKKDYGLIPEYIKEMKANKAKNQKLTDKPHDFSKRTQRNSNNNLSNEYNYQYRQYNRPRMIRLPEEERLKILSGLKKNYEILTNEYKSISLILDTCAKVKRKSKLEEQLREIEKSIDKFNQPNIIISS
ncbi:hypothetical protein BCR32DRAFT_265240 [Anaeromyces robustus]|uniref:Enkurin domain-containing protein n=1 Tax=Anaeromyces robustus TaxID=1754192 RepID=A0A1Y1XK01_9FUNG|nr:hypothetical protein BCR32DRAFT_265240 [Anaeromyces robustus]|eukprot:ORX86042.1 hypothetical protein BCR32DRAFT_265240 [Anaeromyces robustus]